MHEIDTAEELHLEPFQTDFFAKIVTAFVS